MSTNSAVVGIGTAVGAVSDDACGETHWIVSAWVVLDVADVVRVSDTNAVMVTGRVDARLVDGAVMETESTLVIVNTGVKWRSRLLVARVAVWTETSSGANLWWRNLQAKELALVGVDIVADLSFWNTVVSTLFALVDVLAALLSALLVAEEIVGSHGVSVADETVLADAVVSSESVAGDTDGVMVALVVACIAVAVWIWIRRTEESTWLVDAGLADAGVCSGLALVNIDAALWSIWSVGDLFGRSQDQSSIGDDILSVTVALVSADALAVVSLLLGSIWNADCHLMTLVSTGGADVEGIWKSRADEGAVSVDALLTELVACVVYGALVNIGAAWLTDAGVVLETVAAEAFEAHAVVSFFVVVWNAGSGRDTGVCTIVASGANRSASALASFAVVATDGVDARLVVGTVVSTGKTLVHVLAALAISGVTVFTSTLEGESTASESAHGVFVTVVSSNCATGRSLKSGATHQVIYTGSRILNLGRRPRALPLHSC